MKKVILKLMMGALAVVAVSCTGSKSADNDNAAIADGNTGATPSVVVLEGNDTIKAMDVPVFIDFNATWCGPCKAFAPIYDQVAEKFQGKALFYSVDVDKFPGLAQVYSVSAIPQVSILYPDGTIYNSEPGLMDAESFEALVVKSLEK